MALTVKDIQELPSGQRMKLLAGGKGLARPVISVEIADYEFAQGLEFAPEADFDLERDMEAGSFIITSFLFAKDDPAQILPALRKMEEMGMAGLAYKQIIYRDLPEEVLEFAEKKDFPVFAFEKDVWFENIIFDIMYAVQFDDKEYLSEDKIRAMLEGRMSRSELDIILKGISLKLRRYVTAAFVSGRGAGLPEGLPEGSDGSGQTGKPGAVKPAAFGFDAGRSLRAFYLSKGLRDRALMVRYEDGLFIITTSSSKEAEAHRLILRQVMDLSGIPETLAPALSDVHDARNLDQAFRESRFCFIAAQAEKKTAADAGISDFISGFDRFGESGVYRMLLPVAEAPAVREFADGILGGIRNREDLAETAAAYVCAGGDIRRAAEILHCHQNTVRYRLGRIREMTGLEASGDPELYMQIKLASAVSAIRYFSSLL